MTAPKLSNAITWDRFERAVLAVFREALRRLAQIGQLPGAEEPINLELYWLVRQVHFELMRSSPSDMFSFSVLFDSTNQPEPDDVARSSRLRKRPDFSLVLTDPKALDFRSSQVGYYVECKRLGQAEGTWVLNENYSGHGINRFVHPDWQYGKGCKSATMVGYLQNTEPAVVLSEVNEGAASRGLPSLSLAAASWAVQSVTPLRQDALNRDFAPETFCLGHLWIDLRHCQFVDTTATPPASAALPSPHASINSPAKRRKNPSTKKPTTKVISKEKGC